MLMELQLCVTVEAAPQGAQVRPIVTGDLAASDHQALFLLAKQVRGLSTRTLWVGASRRGPGHVR
ncbi:hypothetical protein CRM73_02185 [Kocuria sp. CCUG 69068]|nr:hypothetical protein [Kocuria sp. CCUG 69068]